MLSLPKLHQQYKKQHPQYHDPLARYSPEDQELEKIKRTALSPYLQKISSPSLLCSMMWWLMNLDSLPKFGGCNRYMCPPMPINYRKETAGSLDADGPSSASSKTASTACPGAGVFGRKNGSSNPWKTASCTAAA